MFRNFIHRPVLAIVISVLIVFMGLLSIESLPTAQFPEIAPTTVNIFIAYPGSSADVLTKSTIIQLETAINGVQGMRYIASDATSAGEGTIRVIFEPGFELDTYKMLAGCLRKLPKGARLEPWDGWPARRAYSRELSCKPYSSPGRCSPLNEPLLRSGRAWRPRC